MKKITVAVILLASMILPSVVKAQNKIKTNNEMTVEVGGAPMFPSKNIVENATRSKEHTTLVAALNAAGLVETLQSMGPFTVFAPTNAAFGKLPTGTVDQLLQPANKPALVSVLTYHVVPGKLDSKELTQWIKKGGGKTTLTTVQGGKLWILQNADGLWLKDGKGNTAKITIKDVYQSNGIIHVIDTVLMPQ